MFPNLEMEQGRNGHSDEYVARRLGMPQNEYCSRKESGAFVVSEIDILLDMYDKPFEYLFRCGAQEMLKSRRGG